MKILILGSGLMGPAAAFNAMSDPNVEQVTLCDRSREPMEAARAKLADLEGSQKLSTVVLDLNDLAAAARLLARYDTAIAALPREVIPAGIRAALAAQTPLVDLSRPLDSDMAALRREIQAGASPVILGCGVEPGLTEIMARHLSEKLDRVDELHIMCGGIPEVPEPPLGYKIVFGGRELPLREGAAHLVADGELTTVPRYSGVETVVFPGVGECEAWHEGFMPWLLDLKALKDLRHGTQKTIRWPGYAAKVTVLREMGLLGQDPVQVDSAWVSPKKLLDALLYPRVQLLDGEHDLTLFRVEVRGEASGQPRRYRVDMVDRYDEMLGFTSMARTTAFTGAIVARMVARGDLQAQGMATPEQVVTGDLFDQLVADLASANICFVLTSEITGTVH